MLTQNGDLGYGERRCGFNTKHQSTKASRRKPTVAVDGSGGFHLYASKKVHLVDLFGLDLAHNVLLRTSEPCQLTDRIFLYEGTWAGLFALQRSCSHRASAGCIHGGRVGGNDVKMPKAFITKGQRPLLQVPKAFITNAKGIYYHRVGGNNGLWHLYYRGTSLIRNSAPPRTLEYWSYWSFNEQSTSATPVGCPWTQCLDGHRCGSRRGLGLGPYDGPKGRGCSL